MTRITKRCGSDNHIMPKDTVMGGYGGGHMSARKADRFDCVPWRLLEGDNTYVHIATGEEGENKSKPKVGTLEKAAAQTKKGSPLTRTSFGTTEAKNVRLASMYLALNSHNDTPSMLFNTIS